MEFINIIGVQHGVLIVYRVPLAIPLSNRPRITGHVAVFIIPEIFYFMDWITRSLSIGGLVLQDFLLLDQLQLIMLICDGLFVIFSFFFS
ncbi:hypothetical protein D3C75_1021820 [compost metagenome]